MSKGSVADCPVFLSKESKVDKVLFRQKTSRFDQPDPMGIAHVESHWTGGDLPTNLPTFYYQTNQPFMDR